MSKKAAEINEQIPWQELTTGCEIYEPGTSRLTMTGEWRSKVPVLHKEKCKQCLLCAPFCPDSSIPVKDGKREDFDYDHCKGIEVTKPSYCNGCKAYASCNTGSDGLVLA